VGLKEGRDVGMSEAWEVGRLSLRGVYALAAAAISIIDKMHGISIPSTANSGTVILLAIVEPVSSSIYGTQLTGLGHNYTTVSTSKDRHQALITKSSICIIRIYTKADSYPVTQAETRCAPNLPIYCIPVLPMGK
jgi:hypothetical protein